MLILNVLIYIIVDYVASIGILCVLHFFILTLNILFLGTKICIFTNANAIFKSCDFWVHFPKLSHEYYNRCL